MVVHGISCLIFPPDTHSKTRHLKALPEGDVLMHAGDFSNVGLPLDIERFCEFLKAQPHPNKVISKIHTFAVYYPVI